MLVLDELLGRSDQRRSFILVEPREFSDSRLCNPPTKPPSAHRLSSFDGVDKINGTPSHTADLIEGLERHHGHGRSEMLPMHAPRDR
jgi:hypothetical protein